MRAAVHACRATARRQFRMDGRSSTHIRRATWTGRTVWIHFVVMHTHRHGRMRVTGGLCVVRRCLGVYIVVVHVRRLLSLGRIRGRRSRRVQVRALFCFTVGGDSRLQGWRRLHRRVHSRCTREGRVDGKVTERVSVIASARLRARTTARCARGGALRALVLRRCTVAGRRSLHLSTEHDTTLGLVTSKYITARERLAAGASKRTNVRVTALMAAQVL